ncbi:MAG: DUF1499 domain-containing protein [Myxococcota bacterium]
MAEDHPDRLRPCPSSPNCVSTQADPDDTQHHIPPLRMDGDLETAREHLERIVLGMPRSRIVDEGERYLHVTFRSRLFGFVDDVEFLLEPDEGLIQMRSASRKGWSDLGVNRRRLETIRRRWDVD